MFDVGIDDWQANLDPYGDESTEEIETCDTRGCMREKVGVCVNCGKNICHIHAYGPNPGKQLCADCEISLIDD